MPLDLVTNIAHRPPGGSFFDAALDKEPRILIFMDLFEIETILEGHVAGFLNILPESLTAHPYLMPDSIFLHSFINKPWNIK